jgi:hypothetical protein
MQKGSGRNIYAAGIGIIRLVIIGMALSSSKPKSQQVA